MKVGSPAATGIEDVGSAYLAREAKARLRAWTARGHQCLWVATPRPWPAVAQSFT